MPNTVQTLDARYIDGAKLLELLKTLFGPGNFQINCIDDSYTLIIPERLTRDQELQISIPGQNNGS